MIDEMKRELNGLKADIRSIAGRFDNIEAVLRRVAATVSRLLGDTTDMRRCAATREDINRIETKIDAFAVEIEASRRERALKSDSYMLHQRRIDNHEKRLARLEARRV